MDDIRADGPDVLRHWSLLLNDCERLFPTAFDALLGHPLFEKLVPSWRWDDIQVSMSKEGGGIGPHVDSYDVFLIQGEGTRQWAIENDKVSEADELARLEDNPDIRILKEFQQGQQWTMERGDVLYLPPRVSHRGMTVSSTTAFTFSVGFRSPKTIDFAASLLEAMYEPSVQQAAPVLSEILSVAEPVNASTSSISSTSSMSSPSSTSSTSSAFAISPDHVEAAAQLTLKALADVLGDAEVAARWFGRTATRPVRVPVEPLSDDFDSRGGVEGIQKLGIGRWAYWSGSSSDSKAIVFVDGEDYDLEGPGAAAMARALCEQAFVPLEDALKWCGRSSRGGDGPPLVAGLAELEDDGWIVLMMNDNDDSS